MSDVFTTRRPAVVDNVRVREPQRGAYEALQAAALALPEQREFGIVLPVGCGKSGCITLAPFALRSRRALIVAPGLPIAKQLSDDFDPTNPHMFYLKVGALDGPPFPEPVEIRGTTTNRADLEEAEVVITNIQQLQGAENRWLAALPEDFFDLIVFDEGHHSVAATFEQLKSHFGSAAIVNFSATPLRADGQRMAGEIIYSYPVFQAIQQGYVKRLRAIVLNPSTLKYVRQHDGEEIEVELDEVRRLGEVDGDFRRSILTSTETLNTITDASIRELQRIREETDDCRHKIIASALNFQHCAQVVASYRERNLRADYVHSREDSAINAQVMSRLANHELDVIVQVRKLGEGFDHKYLSVAAVYSLFANLAPFVQFVGRIMRVVVQDSPGHVQNQGSVVFHAGANVARRWEDFQQFSLADQEYFDQLLPMTEPDFTRTDEVDVTPVSAHTNTTEVREQTAVTMEEIPLIESDAVAMDAIATLRERGYSPEQVRAAMLVPVPTTRALERQAARSLLDTRVNTETGRILAERRLNPGGLELDQQHRGRTNYVVIKSAIDRQINRAAGRAAGERWEFSRAQLDEIGARFDELVADAVREVFDGSS